MAELVRNLKGLVSPIVQMQLMKDMPRSFNDAVELARKLETAEQARGACAKKDGTRFQLQLSCPSEGVR